MWPFVKKSDHPGLEADLACLGKNAGAAVRFVTTGKEPAILGKLGSHPEVLLGPRRGEYLVDETQPALMWRLGQLYLACGAPTDPGWEPGLEPLEPYLQALAGVGKIRARVVVWMLDSQGLKAPSLVRSYLKMVGSPTGALLEGVVAWTDFLSEHRSVFPEFLRQPSLEFLRHLQGLGFSPEPWQDELFQILGEGGTDTAWVAYFWLERLGAHFATVIQRNLGRLTRPQRLAAVEFVARYMGPGPAADYLQRYSNESGMPEAILELRKADARKKLT